MTFVDLRPARFSIFYPDIFAAPHSLRAVHYPAGRNKKNRSGYTARLRMRTDVSAGRQMPPPSRFRTAASAPAGTAVGIPWLLPDRHSGSEKHHRNPLPEERAVASARDSAGSANHDPNGRTPQPAVAGISTGPYRFHDPEHRTSAAVTG